MSNRITPWYDVYGELAKAMRLFYERNKDQPAKALFNACSSNPSFIPANQWILNKEASGGLDPIQVFASINSLTLGAELRMSRIKALFAVFALDNRYYGEKIDFSGCPTPVAIKLLSFRETGIQNQIWEAFAAVLDKGQEGLDKGQEGLDKDQREIFGIMELSPVPRIPELNKLGGDLLYVRHSSLNITL